MGYLPQFIAGDATTLGKSLVTATPTQSAARDLIGLGEGDSPQFAGGGFSNDVKIGTVDPHINSGSFGRRLTIQAPGGTPVRQAILQLVGGASTTHNQTIGAVEFHNPNFADANGRTRIAEIYSASSGGALGSDLRFRTTQHQDTAVRERMRILGTGKVIVGASYADDGADDLLQVNGSTRVGSLYGNGGTLAIRNGTNAQSLLLTKTYTSDTNYAGLRFDTADAAYRIGSAVGSAGGVNRNLELGRYSGDGSWLPAMTIRTNGNVGIGSTNPSYPFIVVPSADNPGWVAVDSFGNNQPGIRLQTASIFRGSSGGVVINESTGGSTGTLQVVGPIYINESNPTLRMGSGVQSAQITTSWNTGNTNIKIRNVGTQSTSLRIVGGLCVGTAYENTAPPTDGAIIEGRLGVGISSPATPLHVIGEITLDNLPTSDPAIAGQVWNDNGTLKISAG